MTTNVPAAPSGSQPPSNNQSQSESLPAEENRINEDGSSVLGPRVEEGREAEKKLHPLVAGFSKLPMVRQIGLMIGLAASIALGLAVVLWSTEETYRPLMNSNNTYDAREVIDVLQLQGITFDIDPVSGLILVKESDLHKARLAIAGAGLSDDKTIGFELLDQDQGLGTSQFMETTRYRRGLEGELARTIASMNQVKSARVHLAIPRQSVFVRDNREATASVFLEMYSGTTLEKEQAKAITNLVATSVPDLNAEMVTIVDQKGRLLSNFDEDPEATQTEKQFEYTQKVEDSVIRRINSILEPVIGQDAFRAEVAADVDFTRLEQTEELFNPDLIALRSEQTISEEKTGEFQGGIPGALTNQPPGNAAAPEEVDENGNPVDAKPTSKRDEATRNYEVDRTLSYTQHQQGRLRRLTVAVVVDDMKTVTENGEVTKEPWSQEELDRIRILVQDAVGYDASRGDSVNVINSPFMAPDANLEEITFWNQPWFWDVMKQVLAGLFVLILIFGVFRPAIKNLISQGEEDQEDEEGIDSLTIDEEAISDDKVTLSGADEYLLPGPSEGFERQLDALRGLIAEDPGKVAMVLRNWIMADD